MYAVYFTRSIKRVLLEWTPPPRELERNNAFGRIHGILLGKQS